MSDLVFVDTNVIVYSRDLRESGKQARALSWMEHLWRTRSGRLSTQVLNEYYVTVTQKLKPGVSAAEARADVRSLFLWAVPTSPKVLAEAAWEIQDRYRFSYWDALIVASAQASGCRYLLSEDLVDGQVLDGLSIVSPFTREPAELGLE